MEAPNGGLSMAIGNRDGLIMMTLRVIDVWVRVVSHCNRAAEHGVQQMGFARVRNLSPMPASLWALNCVLPAVNPAANTSR